MISEVAQETSLSYEDLEPHVIERLQSSKPKADLGGMDHEDFSLDAEFICGDRRWRCTDVGRRTIMAIRIDAVHAVTSHPDGRKTERRLDQAEAEGEGWFNGPPYAVAEHVFDEYDFEGCEPG